MARKLEVDEGGSGWLWRFVKGVVVAVVLCGLVAVGLSLFVLPPAEPPPAPATSDQPAKPEMIAGIEVSQTPAYSQPADAVPAQSPGALPPIALSGPALAVNAVPFEADNETPLVAVVLDDTAAKPLLHELIFAQELPLTVGVVAGRDGDGVTAEGARSAGMEVLAELPIARPGVAMGDELVYGLPEEEAMRRADLLMRRVPMAVAASQPMAENIPPDASVLLGIGAALQPHGFGWLDKDVALMDAAPGKAAGLPVPVAASRFAVPEGADLAAVLQVLDAAAEDAKIRGAAVVLAPPSEAVMGAMQLWSSTGAAKLAPLSAAIRRLSAG